MIPWAIKSKDLDPEHLSVFRVVVNKLNKMEEKPGTGPGLTCHDVCEKLLAEDSYLAESLVHVRGKFNYYDHSWLEFKLGRGRVVIDAYPWASSGPFMVCAWAGSPWATLYREKPAVPEGG